MPPLTRLKWAMSSFFRGDLRHEESRAGTLGGESVLRVPQRTSGHGEAAASDAAVQLVSKFRKALNAIIQVFLPAGRQVAPVLGGCGPIAGKRRECIMNAGQGNTEALRDFDDGDATQDIARILALIAQGA